MGNVAQIVTERILKRMEEMEDQIQRGEATSFRWVKPFALGAPDRPYSFEKSLPYTGINRILLCNKNGEYLTKKCIDRLGEKKDSPKYQIRKGAKSEIVCYYEIKPVIDKETGEPAIDEITGKEIKKTILRFYPVFSREDVVRCDNGETLPSKFEFEHFTHEDITEQTRIALDRFNRLFNFFCKKYGIIAEEITDGTQCYYSPSDNRLRYCRMDGFSSVFEYISTVAHEMVHATGKILGRFDDTKIKSPEEAVQSYSREELCAEIGSEICTNFVKCPDDSDTNENSIIYIRNWSSYLKNNPKTEILSASAKAEQACELIYDCLLEMEREEQMQKDNEEKENDEDER